MMRHLGFLTPSSSSCDTFDLPAPSFCSTETNAGIPVLKTDKTNESNIAWQKHRINFRNL
ncbi:hypothetical protein E2C01_023206 [Portunus trituberculatus]|uniref:Uncharacterized protein n=1 Tax=Portunus trituberculatus TaxID=210409 RepID=A0A5B7E7E3_PORTR|nr:hypothetical protein [Portunus trituberculatus]